MQSICDQSSLKKFFFFCNYQEKSLTKRVVNFFYRYVYNLFTNSKKTYSSVLIPLFVKYAAFLVLMILALVVYIYYGAYIRKLMTDSKNWCLAKYFESIGNFIN